MGFSVGWHREWFLRAPSIGECASFSAKTLREGIEFMTLAKHLNHQSQSRSYLQHIHNPPQTKTSMVALKIALKRWISCPQFRANHPYFLWVIRVPKNEVTVVEATGEVHLSQGVSFATGSCHQPRHRKHKARTARRCESGQYRFAVASGESRGSSSCQHFEAHPTLPRIGTDRVSHCRSAEMSPHKNIVRKTRSCWFVLVLR